MVRLCVADFRSELTRVMEKNEGLLIDLLESDDQNQLLEDQELSPLQSISNDLFQAPNCLENALMNRSGLDPVKDKYGTVS